MRHHYRLMSILQELFVGELATDMTNEHHRAGEGVALE